jgi:predicted nucleotidyltransferase
MAWRPVPVTEQIIAEITREIVRAADPDRVILFGSHARGDARPDSDLDLLIIEDAPFDGTRSRREESARLWRALRRFLIPKDILVFSRDEVERWASSMNHVIGKALREGRVLYARP